MIRLEIRALRSRQPLRYPRYWRYSLACRSACHYCHYCRYYSSYYRLPLFDVPAKCISAHWSRILSYSLSSNTSAISLIARMLVYTVGNPLVTRRLITACTYDLNASVADLTPISSTTAKGASCLHFIFAPIRFIASSSFVIVARLYAVCNSFISRKYALNCRGCSPDFIAPR